MSIDKRTDKRAATPARRAGMRSIGVLTSHAELHADIVVRSLEVLKETAFDDLLSDAQM